MPEKIIVKHEIDLQQLERFEKALKSFKEQGDMKKIVEELKEKLKYQEKSNKESQKELGIVGKLIKQRNELRRAVVDAKTKTELKKVNKELADVNIKLKRAKGTMQTWSKALTSFQFKFNALGNIAANVASAITRGFNRAMREAVRTVIEFESAMAGVKAITGATQKEFQKLQKDAIRLGGATIYTARQVAQLQMNYAKLGFSADEIVKVTEATLSLAAATDEGLAQSALIAGSTLRSFGYDALQMKRVIDVMAKSFTSSALTLETWGESVKFSASLAHAAGLNIEGYAAALQVLANANIKGSIAGTSMKNLLLRMVDANSKFSRSVGFTIKNTDDFIHALDVLKKKHIDLSTVLELTDRRTVNAAKVLISNTDALEDNYEAAKKARGAAKEMADIRMDTLKGSITILKSAWEGLILTIDSGNGAISNFAEGTIKALTKVINKVKNLNKALGDIWEEQGKEGAKTTIENKMYELRGMDIKKQEDVLNDMLKNAKKQLKEYQTIMKKYPKITDLFYSTGAYLVL